MFAFEFWHSKMSFRNVTSGLSSLSNTSDLHLLLWQVKKRSIWVRAWSGMIPTSRVQTTSHASMGITLSMCKLYENDEHAWSVKSQFLYVCYLFISMTSNRPVFYIYTPSNCSGIRQLDIFSTRNKNASEIKQTLSTHALWVEPPMTFNSK